MLAKILSFGLNGIVGYKLDVEIDLTNGMPNYEVVGLPDAAIKEGKERIRSAIMNSGFGFPAVHITINLAPADTKKEGSYYDLPIAVGILSATDVIDYEKTKKFAFLGELSLDGSLRKINGVLPMLISAREMGFENIIIPKDNQNEASYISGLNIFPISNLTELVNFFTAENLCSPLELKSYTAMLNSRSNFNDFKYIKGQSQAKRALEISAAGGHNIMMIGPPGAGKTMLARAFAGILPDMSFEEALECTKIHSIAGILDANEGIIASRPFRSPHHTTTVIALTGGGQNAKPGEISLAHNGVLFLDELPEYNRHTIETLRQPLEDGFVCISRNKTTVEYPAHFMLVASMNPCPCGYYGSKKQVCKCSPSQIYKYLSKLSGPLMDRIDIHMEVEGITYDEIKADKLEESSEEIKKRVNKAREVQLKRFQGLKIYSNSQMPPQLINKYCKLDTETEELLQDAFEKLNLSARGHNRILKVARTIADLEGSENIQFEHIAEAIGYRALDKKYQV